MTEWSSLRLTERVGVVKTRTARSASTRDDRGDDETWDVGDVGIGVDERSLTQPLR